MPSIQDTVADIAGTTSWDARVTKIRQITQHHGAAEQSEVYATIGQRLYAPNLTPDYAYIHWRDEYELDGFKAAYAEVFDGTNGFTDVDPNTLAKVVYGAPPALRILRTISGLTTQEFAEATRNVSKTGETAPLSNNRIKTIEQGGLIKSTEAEIIARTIDKLVNRTMFPEGSPDYRLKQVKPDTAAGWDSVRELASVGVPFDIFLHQRHYGGAFRQLLDATSSRRGDIIEDVVEQIFSDAGVPFIRTGSHNQPEIETRFGLTVKPAPDFVVFDATGNLRAMLECKAANDGGTARDKASRFRSIRDEARRLGGIPVLAVLGGLGWKRTNDTLGPVVRDCDGRVFTLANLGEILDVSPFPQLVGVDD